MRNLPSDACYRDYCNQSRSVTSLFSFYGEEETSMARLAGRESISKRKHHETRIHATIVDLRMLSSLLVRLLMIKDKTEGRTRSSAGRTIHSYQ